MTQAPVDAARTRRGTAARSTTRSDTMATQPARPATASNPIHTPSSSPRTVEHRVAFGLLVVVGGFQLALAAGAPWGAAAWAGQSPGVLPTSLRVASAVSVLVYGGLAAIIVTARVSPRARRRVLTGASVLMWVGVAANLATPSPVERIWAPVAATLAVMLWRIRAPRLHTTRGSPASHGRLDVLGAIRLLNATR